MMVTCLTIFSAGIFGAHIFDALRGGKQQAIPSQSVQLSFSLSRSGTKARRSADDEPLAKAPYQPRLISTPM